jgi:AraC-like DNA-binding protein
MPRSKQELKRLKVESADVERAADLVLQHNWSILRAASECEVSKSTLARHLNMHKAAENQTFQYTSKCNTNRVFSPQEEELLKNYLKQVSLIHYGLTRKKIRILALDFAQVNKKKIPDSWIVNGRVGKNWYYEFMNRQKDALSLRKPQATSLSRSTSFITGTMFPPFLQN